MGVKCTKCLRPAIIYQRYSGLHLCESHFIADFEVKAKRTMRQNRWLVPGEKIAVALSGGKDSSALLYFLTNLVKNRRDITLVAITVDEGIMGYRNPSDAVLIAGKMGVTCITASFQEAFDLTMDQIVSVKGDRLSCSYCGVLRRHLLNRVARKIGADRIAYGFNLDDEAQSVLMNVLRGDINRLCMQPSQQEGMIQRIRPFREIPEREVALYAILKVGFSADTGCPYAHNALRSDVRKLLNTYAWNHPSARYSLIKTGEGLKVGYTPGSETLSRCERCGEPAGTPCRVCAICDEVRHDKRA